MSSNAYIEYPAHSRYEVNKTVQMSNDFESYCMARFRVNVHNFLSSSNEPTTTIMAVAEIVALYSFTNGMHSHGETSIRHPMTEAHATQRIA